ncbi:MAG: hypothetical protein JST42_07645 [Bacteroidetes bacterium]|nr:hypothetical protein [Bacteroidota bacterium]
MKQAKLLLIFVGYCAVARAQVQLSGTIYDASARFTLQGVSVIGASGRGTTTDTLGHYSISLSAGDSVYFSYLGRATARIPVKDIPAGIPFDMSLDIAVDSLPAVYVRSHNYLLDSLENRREYKNVFDYNKGYVDGLRSGRGGRSAGVGIDFDMLLDGRKNREMLTLQKRLIYDEDEKYIDHRWTKSLVHRITGLESPALDTFMRAYRPTKEFIQSFSTDYEFDHYIQEWGKFFAEDWRTNHPKDSGLSGIGSAGGAQPAGGVDTARGGVDSARGGVDNPRGGAVK